MEVSFSTAAQHSRAVCFGSGAKPVLLNTDVFAIGEQSIETGSRLGLGKRLGRDTAEVVTQTDPRDALHHMTSNSEIRSSGEEVGREVVCGLHICQPKKPSCVLRPRFPGNSCLSAC